MTVKISFLGSPALGRVLDDIPLTGLDIGARGGFSKDLLPMASAVDACGFEPDIEECDRLNSSAAETSAPWKSLRYVPAALSEKGGPRTLYLTQRRGTSSLLGANTAFAEKFGRGEYFIVDDTVEIDTVPLDSIVDAHGIADAAYMKIDVEGYEMEVFRAAKRLLDGPLLAIRCEVTFVPARINQPYYADIESFLRSFGFFPMGFAELHHWRRRTRLKHPIKSRGLVPYSKGQMMHGDMVFFRDPDTMPDDTETAIQQLLRAAFIAATYEYVDHAAAIMQRPAVANYLADRYGIDPERELNIVSRTLARKFSKHQRLQRWYAFKGIVGRSLGLIR
jgi:FkbM family methyltransferase